MVQDLKEESKIFKDENLRVELDPLTGDAMVFRGVPIEPIGVPDDLKEDGIETVEAYKKKPRKRKDKLTEINE